jgi:predicted signal transduction protein with EAL and GGDEF domain
VIAQTVKPPAVAPRLVAERGGEAPVPVWLLAALAALAALAGALTLAGWWRGWDVGRVTRPFGAAAADAGGRTADLAGEFADWLRLGR